MERQPIPVEEQQLTHREEREIYNRQWAQEKAQREIHNQQLFTGWRGSVFIREGVGQTKASGV